MRVSPARLGLLLLLSACAHGEGFEYQYQPLSGPLELGPPVLLARDLLEDQFASWMPDGSGVLYSYIPDATGPRDRCLGVVPAGGGQMTRSRCYRWDLGSDTTDVLAEAAARSPDDVAWMEQHNLANRRVPDFGAIVLGSLDERVPTTRLVSLPYTASSGSVHATITNLRWLTNAWLAYIGNDIIIRAPCDNCKPDTVVVAKEVMLVNRNGDAPQVLAGSEQTTSIWPTTEGGLYYTVGGDTRVWRRALAGGAAEVVHDFGAAGIVRDVSVAGDRLAAIVGGNVSYGSEFLIPLRQVDSGGNLATVNLTTGDESILQIEKQCFRRPALSPSGDAVVVEMIDRATTNPNPNLLLYSVQ